MNRKIMNYELRITNYELRIEKATPSQLNTHNSQLATSPLWLASMRPESSASTDRGYRLATHDSLLATHDFLFRQS